MQRSGSTLRAGDVLPLASTKYDGSHHYRYRLSVVAAEPGHLRAWAPAGTALDSYRGRYPASRHGLHLHWTDRDWNLEVMWHQDWSPNSHYVNVALPSAWEDGTLRFVDLDLDVIWAADGRVILDDVDEFHEHRERFGYPPELVERAWKAAQEVTRLVEDRIWPFDGSLYSWRPAEPPGTDQRRPAG